MTKYLCPICKHFCFDQKIEQTFCYLNGTTADKYVKTLAISNERVRCKHCDHLLDRHELKEFHKYVDKDENVDYGLMEEIDTKDEETGCRKTSTKVNLDGKHYDIISTIEVRPSDEEVL